MDRLILFVALLSCVCAVSANQEFNCKRAPTGSFPKETCYNEACATAIKDHIQHEFNAAFKYMYMGAYFAQDVVSRPGIAKFLLESASEERSHAIQMLDYLNLRGIKLDEASVTNYSFDTTKLFAPSSYKSALEEALNMEIEVTDLIHNVVDKCKDDFHGADVFTNPILDEQHDGLRKLQGAVREFDNLQESHSINSVEYNALAEFMFDRKLLSGELF